MSLLHHSVAWTLTDSSNRQLIFRIVSHRSVSNRFSFLFNPQVMNYMDEVMIVEGNLSIEGFLSRPLKECCHGNKEFQFFYVNKRWMKNTEFLSSVIDGAYVSAFSTNKSGGPEAKHYEPTGYKAANHPCFILQLFCPEKEYDVLVDPDKSTVVFRDPSRVKQIIKKIVLDMFRRFNNELLPIVSRNLDFADADVIGLKYSTPPQPDKSKDECNLKTLPSNSDFSKFSFDQTGLNFSPRSPLSYSAAKASTPDSESFFGSFFPSPNVDSGIPLSSLSAVAFSSGINYFHGQEMIIASLKSYDSLKYLKAVAQEDCLEKDASNKELLYVGYEDSNECGSNEVSDHTFFNSGIKVSVNRDTEAIDYFDRRLCDFGGPFGNSLSSDFQNSVIKSSPNMFREYIHSPQYKHIYGTAVLDIPQLFQLNDTSQNFGNNELEYIPTENVEIFISSENIDESKDNQSTCSFYPVVNINFAAVFCL